MIKYTQGLSKEHTLYQDTPAVLASTKAEFATRTRSVWDVTDGGKQRKEAKETPKGMGLEDPR